MPKWLKRGLWGLLAVVIILPLSGALYQAIASAIDRRTYPPPGQLVDVGGYRLHLYCTGQNTDGRPTVIFETGLGGFATSADWAWVQPQVANVTRACAYDRAGLGWSDPGPQPRDAQHIAAELHALLQKSGTPGPYVLVGWSFGGLYVRAYANQYRDEVAGLVLLESSSPEQCTASPAWQAQCASSARNASLARVLALFGAMRVFGLFQPATGLPGPQNGALRASFSSTKDWDAQNAEFQASAATNAQVLGARALGNLPLFVLTATEHGGAPELEQQWQVWQAGFTALSTNSLQQVVRGATHESLVFGPTDSRITGEAILQVVEAAHTGGQLKR
jgi:pimeloyl-ACP methyl ester carboxylesterase